jgi:contact-dependent growth inhibition (CDI) system CdiA-like toxin
MLWARPPTGPPGGSPTGPRAKISPNQTDRNRRGLTLENECADSLAHKGYQVHQNPTAQEIADARLSTGDTGDPKKTPDYVLEGHVFDCYSPTPSKPVRGVWTEVSRKVTDLQTQRVVINLQDWGGDVTALRKQFDDWPIPRLKELVAVTRGGAIMQIVPRH